MAILTPGLTRKLRGLKISVHALLSRALVAHRSRLDMSGLTSSSAAAAQRAARLMLIASLAVGSSFGQAASNQPAHRQPVLVELFTSEGCSDCPPADALLARLDREQFVPDAEAIVLSEHVTYWNHEGWRDPFSMPEIDERQRSYVYRFGLQDSYTPQAVVDGSLQLVGNNANALTQAVEQAARQPKESLTIENAHWVNGGVDFSVHVQPESGAKLEAALAQDATHREVTGGENAGRTLQHVAVVRAMKDFSTKALDGRTLRLAATDLSQSNDARGPLRLVVFVADRKSGHILAVAGQTLTP